jgi:hypothetical protein
MYESYRKGSRKSISKPHQTGLTQREKANTRYHNHGLITKEKAKMTKKDDNLKFKLEILKVHKDV